MKTTKLTTRLSSIAVLIVAALLLELTTAMQYFSTRTGITRQMVEMAHRDLSESDRTAELKREVELTVAQMLPTLGRLTSQLASDSLHLYIDDILGQQDEIVGFDFCLVKGKNGKPDGIYIYKDDKTGAPTEHHIDFDFTKRSWYQEGIKCDGFWSEPYMSNYKVILMCTYSRPVRDAEGQIVAILGADVPMRDVSALASQLFEDQQRSLLPIVLLHGLGLLLLAFIIVRSVRSIRRLQVVGAEKERIANELSIASRIQQAMLPKAAPLPEHGNVELSAALTPAREVGGDFYDFVVRDEKLFFCIGDVSGKGVPAALVMAMAISAFRMMSEHESAPERIIAQINNSMARDNDYNMFITLFIGVLDLKTGKLLYSNAGHKPPMIDNQPLPVTPNLPVGILPEFDFALQETTIKKGSTLFLYTDGLTEAENETHEQFGLERMQAIIDSAVQEEVSPEVFIDRMTEAVHDFVGETEQSDDLTMLALRYQSKQDCTADIELQHHLTLPCDVAQTTRLGEWIEGICETASLSASATMQINLAIEEAVVNVMKYAYPDSSNGEVQIDASIDHEWLKFIITDAGRPFDPTTSDDVDTSLSAEERNIGGLGIHLMRKMMDSINYERIDGRNVLTMGKKIVKG